MMLITKNKGRYVWSEQERYICFSTTAYLNLAFEARFKDWLKEGLENYGCAYGSSPLTQPKLSVFTDLEQELSNLYGAEAAILYANGFAASQAVVSYYSGLGFEITYGTISHPALNLPSKKAKRAVYAFDIADPINCVLPDIAIEKDYEHIVVDCSHGFGILDSRVKRLITTGATVCGSLNKGLSTPAGLVLCSKEVKDQLIKQSRYASSSAPAPASCYALLQALRYNLVVEQKQKLQKLIEIIPKNKSYDFTFPLPVLKLKNANQDIYKALLKEGFLIWHNQYPKHSKKVVNRVVLHAGLKVVDVNKLLTLIDTLP